MPLRRSLDRATTRQRAPDTGEDFAGTGASSSELAEDGSDIDIEHDAEYADKERSDNEGHEDDVDDDDDEDDEDDEEEEEEEEEPALRYKRLGGSIDALFEKDTASTLAAAERFLVLGTHWGNVI
ncbi:hypothetical protein LPJ56_006263, partial [Coemansia sp. RSA 2599]